ncbi:hypothetical protein BDY17DRAFT_324424 [Neohortaea acidophila]|uniref:DRBM domain-containing protein n=1 Tax=Neohortaea acidophila TaxID=245834 RepID=A0A6A6PVF6_9PEZI|nr:uncharacterized protein BDY17DRAFT_324424 [Neohortaea acidophila]KAF2483711.1 hypothetical protein BDY17DRAFT_324424 [Neohortaea acidophila]
MANEENAEDGSHALSRGNDVPNGNQISTTFPPALNIQSLEDFIRENPYHPPTAGTTQRQSKGDPESVSRFHNLCVLRGITPILTETEVASQAFTAKVVFGELEVEVEEQFPSKKVARGAVCKLALEKLLSTDAGVRKKAKRKRSGANDASTEFEIDEDWVSILNEYAQPKRLRMPEYDDMAYGGAPPKFSCTLKIADAPNETFGYRFDLLHTSKKAAKTMAAKEAVLWLREQGKLPPTPTKRKKIAHPTAAAGHSGSTDISRSLSTLSTDDHVPLPPSQRLNYLIDSLGFQGMWWDLRPSPVQSCLGNMAWDAAITFPDRDVETEPRLAGRLGQVWGVHGKANAKAKCCKNVLPLLEEIQAERIGQFS